MGGPTAPRRRITPWVAVVTLAVLAGAAATASAITAPTRAKAVASPEAAQPSVVPLSTPPAPPSSAPPVPVSTGVPPSSPAPPPASSAPPTSFAVAVCQPGNLVVRLSTDKSTYATGETVHIALTVTNTGSPCMGVELSGPCNDGASVTDGSGQVVWDSSASPYGISVMSCPAEVLRIIPTGWTDSDQLSWTQDHCASLAPGGPPATTNPECPQTQVPTGTYSLIGWWNTNQSSNSALVSITIT